MRILMMTNTYAPVIGGIESSIHSFSMELRKRGHRVVIVAPTFGHMDNHEKDVIRVPAIQNFFQEDISLTLPVPIFLSHFIKEFQPDILHSHHFFLVGDMALRLARQFHLPLAFTHHILLEQYANFFPVHNERVKRFVLKLATGYANLSDMVIAPSQSLHDALRHEGVVKPIAVIPTGIDINRFANGQRGSLRLRFRIPEDAFVVGFVGRLNPEKNLKFLSRVLARFLKANHQAYCLIVGDGSLKDSIKEIFQEAGVAQRLRCTGVLKDQDLVDAYHAMDVFSFSSHSETQGIVLIEAMACATPVAAVAAPAVEELIHDGKNGRLISSDNENEFLDALKWFTQLNKKKWQEIKHNAQVKSFDFSIEHCTDRLLDIYQDLKFHNTSHLNRSNFWDSFKDSLKVEKDLLVNAVEAAEAALKSE